MSEVSIIWLVITHQGNSYKEEEEKFSRHL